MSTRYLKEFPDYTPVLRKTISLGRMTQDPLAELTSASVDMNGFLCLKLHSLQDMVPRELLIKKVELALSKAVNDQCVDINRCVLYPHADSLLCYISGLGLRKANSLIFALSGYGKKIFERNDLLKFLPNKIYQNAIGFLIIQARYFVKSDQGRLSYFDRTRIHPEDYTFARKMISDALGDDVDGDELVADDRVIHEFVKSERKKRKLDDIDLDKFAETYERDRKVKKGITLHKIREELEEPCRDLRAPFRVSCSTLIFLILIFFFFSREKLIFFPRKWIPMSYSSN